MPVQWLAVALKRPLRRRIPVFYHRFVCRLLGIRVRCAGAPVDERPLLIVANHSSWLDISIITACAPVVFVAKSEIARWPFFGLLAKLQRSVFVERDRRHKTARSMPRSRSVSPKAIRFCCSAKEPRATATGCCRSARRLIGAARDAVASAGHTGQVWIQPLSIAYVSQQGIPLGRHLRPRAAWYGKMKLTEHIGAIARSGAVDVSVDVGRADPLRWSDRPQGLGQTAGILGPAELRSRPCAAIRAAPDGFVPFQLAAKGAKTGASGDAGHKNFAKCCNSLEGQTPRIA